MVQQAHNIWYFYLPTWNISTFPYHLFRLAWHCVIFCFAVLKVNWYILPLNNFLIYRKYVATWFYLCKIPFSCGITPLMAACNSRKSRLNKRPFSYLSCCTESTANSLLLKIVNPASSSYKVVKAMEIFCACQDSCLNSKIYCPICLKTKVSLIQKWNCYFYV